ncbi:MAG: hypothetical protein H0U26_04685, partial [Acidimicrobiia bacterium]|nr:hypothetical protein [Acidimicrobiia bacterium]
PTVDNGTAAPRWAMPVAREISRQAVPRLAGRGPVLVRLPLSQPSFAVGPAVFYELARHGIEFVVDDPDLVAQLGSDRRFDGTNAAVVVTLLAGDAALNPPPGIERIAFAPGLDSSERQAKREAELRIAATLAASGSPRLLLDPRKVAALDPVFREGLVLVLREDLPDLARRAAAGDLPALVALIETDLVDDDRFPGVDLARWAKLHRRAETRATALVVEPLP